MNEWTNKKIQMPIIEPIGGKVVDSPEFIFFHGHPCQEKISPKV